MNEELMLEELKKLTMNCGVEIDRIAKETNINQRYIARAFIEVMEMIFEKMTESEG